MTRVIRVGLRSRVALAFGLLSMLVSMLVAGGVFTMARSYLLTQRESASLTRALINARSVDSAIAGGEKPGEVLTGLPVVGSSLALLRVGATWYTRGVTVAPDDLPLPLVEQTLASGGGQQRFAVHDGSYYGVGVYTRSGIYFELFPLDDLEDLLRRAAGLLLGLAVASFVVGGAVGRYAGGSLMRPLVHLREGASKLAAGDLSVRLPTTGDPDLDPISDSFNEMAVAVASRIDRERRFAGNVSHELRSPLTTVVGTAELLESHADRFSERDAKLVRSLASQSRRLSRVLLDLLEIASVTGPAPVQADATDIAGLTEAILRARDVPVDLLHGDRPLIFTDARRVERILSNLVDNAVKYAGGVRQIVIISDRDPQPLHDGQEPPERSAERARAVINVDDAGPGIDPELVERLFEPFVRGEAPAPAAAAPLGGDPRAHGAGLGLAIAREQADAIGAVLRAGPSPYGGARFSLEVSDWLA